jgi:hypothetical protein
MPFIYSYNGAMKILSRIGNGTCKEGCKKSWIRNLKYALKTKTNPLGLNKKQRKNMTEKPCFIIQLFFVINKSNNCKNQKP